MMAMMALMSTESLAGVYKAPIRGLAQGPGGETRETPAPLRASPSPAGAGPASPYVSRPAALA